MRKRFVYTDASDCAIARTGQAIWARRKILFVGHGWFEGHGGAAVPILHPERLRLA